jgi:hypothetical protein
LLDGGDHFQDVNIHWASFDAPSASNAAERAKILGIVHEFAVESVAQAGMLRRTRVVSSGDATVWR